MFHDKKKLIHRISYPASHWSVVFRSFLWAMIWWGLGILNFYLGFRYRYGHTEMDYLFIIRASGVISLSIFVLVPTLFAFKTRLKKGNPYRFSSYAYAFLLCDSRLSNEPTDFSKVLIPLNLQIEGGVSGSERGMTLLLSLPSTSLMGTPLKKGRDRYKLVVDFISISGGVILAVEVSGHPFSGFADEKAAEIARSIATQLELLGVGKILDTKDAFGVIKGGHVQI